MAFIKHASAEITGVYWSPKRVANARTASFKEAKNLLDSDEREYLTDDGFLYVTTRIISSRINQNFDSWGAEDLQKRAHTLIGRPLFVEHQNDDPSRGRGVIADMQVHVDRDETKTASLDPFYSSAECEALHLPPTWIEGLLEVDAQTFPKLAKAIISGDMDSVSMGALVPKTACNICGNEAEDESAFCSHIASGKGMTYDVTLPDGTKVARRAAEHCYNPTFFETSFVGTPADPTALFTGKRTASADRDTVVTARREYLQALNEGADTDGAIRVALSTLKDLGLDREESVAAVKQVISGPAPIVASEKVADRGFDIPLSDKPSVPDAVNTLERESSCPICGNPMDGISCATCLYTAPPDGLDNPDLDKANKIKQQVDDEQANTAMQDEMENLVAQDPGMQPGEDKRPPRRRASATFANPSPVKGEREISASGDTGKDYSGGRVRIRETPLLAPGRQPSDKPKEIQVVKDYSKPVEAKYKVIAADAPEGAGADARVDGGGKGGVGLDADHAKSDSVSREVNVTGDATDTWSDKGTQAKPVTNEAFPKGAAKDDEDDACDCGDCSKCVDEAVKKEAGPKFPDHEPTKVDLDADLKEEVGEGTKTFGNDDFHTTDPVTKSTGDLITAAVSEARTHMLACLKLAETEVALGITAPTEKFARIAALEGETSEAIAARLDSLKQARTASVAAPAPRKTAGSMPPLGRNVVAAGTSHSEEIGDADLLW